MTPSIGGNTTASLTSDETPTMISVQRRNGVMPNAHLKETVKDKVFPRAKFLRMDDLEYSEDRKSWCQMMAKWCNIEQRKLKTWWQFARKVILKELAQQRSNKTNVIKNEFFGKVKQ